MLAVGSTNDIARGLAERFASNFEASPRICRAPGRVNLIGEHTDYNEGFVMPAAVEFYTWVAASARPDRRLVVRSENFAEQVEASLDDLQPSACHHWSDYVLGVARMLEQSSSRLPGANLLIYGDVPQGAGLSSSASLEVAVASALVEISGHTANSNSKDLALLCQRAENEFVGARCGIMDQFIAAHGQRSHALLLDCRSLESRSLPLPNQARLVVCNTMVRHSVAAGEYNTRRAECEEGVRLLAKTRPNIRALRDAVLSDLTDSGTALPPVIMKRCRHVISENERVTKAAGALQAGDLSEFGRLMNQSHASLRDDYEVSCRELDLMVALASRADGVCGARMTGGGFGGCTVNLVRSDSVEAFRETIARGYREATGTVPDIYVCSAADGVTLIQ